MIISSLLL